MLEDISIFVVSVLWAHNNVPVDRPPCMLHHLNTMDFSNLPDPFADNIPGISHISLTFWAEVGGWQWDMNPGLNWTVNNFPPRWAENNFIG